MNNTITPEQTEKIAEWLGFVLNNYPDGRGYFWSKQGVNDIDDDPNQKYMRNWLSSPEGQIAIMDQLSYEGIIVKLQPVNLYVDENFAYAVFLTKKITVYGESYIASATGKERCIALIKAVNEYLTQKGQT